MFPLGDEPGLKSLAKAKGIFFSINDLPGAKGIFIKNEQEGSSVAIVEEFLKAS